MWKPLPYSRSEPTRLNLAAVGAVLYLPGVALYLWGMTALGAQFASGGPQAAALGPGHQLITTGPYALARHPMYLGVLLAAAGAWLIFRTWAMMIFAPMAVVFSIASAAREEKLLERQHRDTWQISCIQSAKVVLVIVLEKRGAHRRRPGSASASRTPDDMGILIVE